MRRLVVLALPLLAGCGAALGPDDGEADLIAAHVEARDGGFSPRSVTVGRQENIRWQNHGTEEHSIVSDLRVNLNNPAPLFASGMLAPPRLDAQGDSLAGQFFLANFLTPGSYPYHCGVHPSETGVITVQPPS